MATAPHIRRFHHHMQNARNHRGKQTMSVFHLRTVQPLQMRGRAVHQLIAERSQPLKDDSRDHAPAMSAPAREQVKHAAVFLRKFQSLSATLECPALFGHASSVDSCE